MQPCTTTTTTLVLPYPLFKWGTSGGGSVSASGYAWTQSGGWTGVVGDSPLCSQESAYEWTINIDKGTYHQVGIALEGWNGQGTSSTSADNKFAYLYSHSSGWNRHRGAAVPVGTPSTSSWWSGTWDHHEKGQLLTVNLDCAEHTFEVSTEKQWLGKMKYPDSWTTVYPSAAGQSSDHAYTIKSIKAYKVLPYPLFKWGTSGGGSVSASGYAWTQSGGWTGVVGDSPLCSQESAYEWTQSGGWTG